MSWYKLSKRQQNEARLLRDRAWQTNVKELKELTVSQIAKDLDGWAVKIEQAEKAR